MQKTTKSKILFTRAKKSIPGGVNSPVRAFNAVGGIPRFLNKAKGAYLYDIDGNKYIDTICSWGPAIVGHSHSKVLKSVKKAAEDGLTFGTPTVGEVELAELIKNQIPSIEMLRLTSSGTEATMSAIRLARGVTKKDKIIKFEGCYHGHVDSLLVKAGSGLLTLGNPTSSGIPKQFAKQTIVLEYNNTEDIKKTFSKYGNSIAAAIIEPFAGNMNLIKPKKGFLETLRKECNKHNSLLIFDEVMTGFRVGPKCAQGLLKVKPDITTLGKVIGGGMPMGAFGGKKEIMQHVSPLGTVYQAGTLSGNPIAVAAGLSTLKLILEKSFFITLSEITTEFTEGFKKAAEDNGFDDFSTDCVGGMFGLYFSKTRPQSFVDVSNCNQDNFKKFFHLMLENGVYLAPSSYEAGFLSIQHKGKPLKKAIKAAHNSFKKLKKLI